MLPDVVAVADGAEGRQEKPETFLPVQEREAAKIVTIQREAVEEDPDDRDGGRRALNITRVREAHARLEPLEARFAAVVERSDLPVDEERLHRKRSQCADQLRVASRDHLAASAVQLYRLPPARSQHPHAIVLDLEEPLLAGKRALRERGQHERLIPRRDIAPGGLEGLHPGSKRRPFGGKIADLLDGETREDRLRVALGELRGGGRGICLLEQEPLLLLLGHPGERPPAAELEAEELDLQLSLGELLEQVALLGWSIPPTIPDDHRAGAVVARRNDPLEIGVLDGVVFHVHRQALLLGPNGRALGHGPALEDPVHLEAQIVVEIPGRVLVDDEETLARNPTRAERLGRPLGVALFPVRVELSSLFLGHGFGASPNVCCSTKRVL